LLPELPRLAHQALTRYTEGENQPQNTELIRKLLAEQRRTNMLLGVIVYFGGGLIGGIIVIQVLMHFLKFY
jgi:ubiquinone biosynthesis protein